MSDQSETGQFVHLEPTIWGVWDPLRREDIHAVLNDYILTPVVYGNGMETEYRYTGEASGRRLVVLAGSEIREREIYSVSLPVVLLGLRDMVDHARICPPKPGSKFTHAVEFPLPNGVTERFSWKEDQAGEPFIVVYQTAEDISTDEKALAYTERVPDNLRFDIYHPRFKGEPQCQATKDDNHGNEVKFVILCPGCALLRKREAVRDQPDKEELIRCLYVGSWR